MYKRMAAIMLAVVMIVSMLPATVYASGQLNEYVHTSVDDFDYIERLFTDCEGALICGFVFDCENEIVFQFLFLSDYDTHWINNLGIYGDDPVKWNERPADPNDPLGLSTYTYKPDITAIMQSGNLYAFCMNNPIMYIDPSGHLSLSLVHNWVVADIHSKYAAVGMTSNKMIDYSFGFGFADLVNLTTGEVWEVKKSTVSMTSAINQLAKYTSNTLHVNKNLALSTGGSKGTVIMPNSFVKTVGFDTYFVNYWDCGNGIIQYDYNRMTDWKAVGNAMVCIVVLAGITYLVVQTGGAAAPAYAIVFAG